jgi:hypothetical protein
MYPDEEEQYDKVLEKTPEIFILTEQIKKELSMLRGKLKPVIYELPQPNAKQMDGGSPVIQEMNILLDMVRCLKEEIAL